MTGLYRDEQLGERQTSPWAEGFRVGAGCASQEDPATARNGRMPGELV